MNLSSPHPLCLERTGAVWNSCRPMHADMASPLLVQLLRRSQSALVLMDMSAELPDLKRTKGLNTWLVKGQNKFYSTWENATDEAVRTHPLTHHPEYLPGQGDCVD